MLNLHFKLYLTPPISLALPSSPLILHHRALRAAWEDNQALRNQLKPMAGLLSQTEDLSNQLARARDTQKLSNAQLSELLRLRGEVALLRRESQDLARLRAERQKTSDAPASTPFVQSLEWANVGAKDPESALQTLLWAGKHSATNLVADMFRMQRDPEIVESDELDRMFGRSVVAATSWFSGGLQAFRVMSKQEEAPDTMHLAVELLDQRGKMTAHNLHFVREQDDWFPVMHVWLQDQGSIRAALDIPQKFKTR